MATAEAITDPVSTVPEETGAAQSVRHRLLRRLTDVVVLPTGRMNVNERQFAADILLHVLDQVPSALRREVAERLAGFADLPTTVLRALATDEIDVACLILERASVVPDDVLISAAEKSPDHRVLIMQRDKLTAPVIEALIRFDEDKVIEYLLTKQDVTLCDPIMDRLVTRSQHRSAICPLLLQRMELRFDQAMAMFWWCGQRDRLAILGRFAVDRGVVQNALQDMFREIYTSADPDPLVKRMLALIDRRHRPRGRNGEEVGFDIVEMTLLSARKTPTPDLAEGVGLLAGISADLATRILGDLGGEAFAVLCKSIGLSRTNFIDLLNCGRGTDPMQLEFDNELIDHLTAVFDTMARDYSRSILRYWDWRTRHGDSFGVVTQSSEEASANGDDLSYFGAV